jgi:hypothetical protein
MWHAILPPKIVVSWLYGMTVLMLSAALGVLVSDALAGPGGSVQHALGAIAGVAVAVGLLTSQFVLWILGFWRVDDTPESDDTDPDIGP